MWVVVLRLHSCYFSDKSLSSPVTNSLSLLLLTFLLRPPLRGETQQQNTTEQNSKLVLGNSGAECGGVMAEEESRRSKGPVRHIVLLKVEKKEHVPEVVKTLADMASEIVKGNHVSWINFDINSDLGIGAGNADVGLVVDFPDEESFQAYQKHDLHVAAVTHNRKFVVGRTAIQLPLPNSSL